MTAGKADRAVREESHSLTDDIHTNTEELLTTLEEVERGSSDELLAGLDYDSSWQLHLTRHLLRTDVNKHSKTEEAALEGLEERLRAYHLGREYFRSLYYKREFSELSTTLLWHCRSYRYSGEPTNSFVGGIASLPGPTRFMRERAKHG